MATLRGEFEAAGLTDVETFIASGNVVFRTPSKNTAAVERKIEARLEKALGYPVRTFVRTGAEVAAVTRHNAFSKTSIQRALALNVGFLAEPLGPPQTATVMSLKSKFDDFHVHGREIYWLCRVRQSESVFTNAKLEKRIGAAATFRGMNTLVRLVDKYGLADD